VPIGGNKHWPLLFAAVLSCGTWGCDTFVADNSGTELGELTQRPRGLAGILIPVPHIHQLVGVPYFGILFARIKGYY
jgi:hypothetical protein